MVGVRIAFDAVLSRHPELTTRLGVRAPIINNPPLESGIVKLIRGQRLAVAEEVECERFRMTPPKPTSTPLSQDSLVMAALKRSPHKNKSIHNCVKWIPPTSNVCERFFSSAKIVYSDLRKRLDMDTLEFLMFLQAFGSTSMVVGIKLPPTVRFLPMPGGPSLPPVQCFVVSESDFSVMQRLVKLEIFGAQAACDPQHEKERD
ncbi:hypothetical protein P43SY_005475 [Pythium insidiosum]|uniref:HAT C-terminal dimerisation domain-containing protein n=1 Tax=Pythium insidiosum TaxID=114742 RepID=A0AAD5Q6T1_PYTIN|nr:hypothetical protein P43SY_005475 [Pythium insidiosum]